MTDIEQNLDETIDIEDNKMEPIENIDKQEGPQMFTGDKDLSLQQSQGPEETDNDEDVDGFSSDFGVEESRGLKCMPTGCLPTTSLHHCLLGRAEPQIPQDQLDQLDFKGPPKKPSSLSGTRTFGQVCRET